MHGSSSRSDQRTSTWRTRDQMAAIMRRAVGPLPSARTSTPRPMSAGAALQLAALAAVLCGGGGDAQSGDGCVALGAPMIMCDGSCAPRARCTDASWTTVGPRTAAGCGQLAPAGAFAGCLSGDCSLAACPPPPTAVPVVSRVVSAVPIAPSALAAEILRRYGASLRVATAQANCSLVLRGLPGQPADYGGAALQFSLRRGIATPAGLTESAVTIERVELSSTATGRRQRRLQDAGALEVGATVVGPADYDLTALAAADYVADMAASAVAVAQQLASGALVVAGIDCSAGACAPATTLTTEIQTAAAAGGGLASAVEFTHRFDLSVVAAASGGSAGGVSAAAALTPELIAELAAAATGSSSTAVFVATVDTGSAGSPPAPPPPPVEDEQQDEDESTELGFVATIVAISVGGLLCVGCGGTLCCLLCRRSAPVGGMKDRATGIGMQRARARAARARAAQETEDQP